MGFRKGSLSTAHRWILAGLLLVPLAVVVGKSSMMPTAEVLGRTVSLTELPAGMRDRLYYVLFVPLGAILVVLCRLTLGIRLLGPFRSILLGIAFQVTGIVAGVLFMILLIGVVAGIRPMLKAMHLPYFGRVSVLLSLVSATMIAIILLGHWLDVEALRRVAYFPIVVLCLVGEGFARTLAKEGARSALWRGSMTVAVAILLTWLSQVPAIRQLLLEYPELLVAQIGAIIAISEFFDLRLLQRINPGFDQVDSEDAPEADTLDTDGLAA